MSSIKIATGLTCGAIILLLFLAITAKKTELELYEETVEELMIQKGVTTNQELEKYFPELIDIQLDLNKISLLNQTILSKTRSPSPVLTKEETLYLKGQMELMEQLREEVRKTLLQLVITYSDNQL